MNPYSSTPIRAANYDQHPTTNSTEPACWMDELTEFAHAESALDRAANANRKLLRAEKWHSGKGKREARTRND